MSNRSASGNRAMGAVLARARAGLALAVLAPGALAAQESSAVYEQPENMLLWWAGLLLLLTALWFILYKIVYPFFLRYYRDDFCKTVFWNLFILYGATLVLLFSYFPLGIGFYYDWTKWLAAFLAALWLISLMVLMLRRRPA